MDITVSELIQRSMRLAGSLQQGEEPTTQEYTDALGILQDLLEVLNIQNLLVYSRTSTTVSLVAGQQSYTIGIDGDIDITRPVKINSASFKINSLEMPVEIIESEHFNDIKIKSLQSPIPRVLYYDQNYPLGILNLYPVPQNGGTLILYHNRPILNVAELTDVISYPPGYSRALRYNLAVEIGAEFGQPVDARVVAIAEESKDEVKTMNSKIPILKFDIGMGHSGNFNWLTGI